MSEPKFKIGDRVFISGGNYHGFFTGTIKTVWTDDDGQYRYLVGGKTPYATFSVQYMEADLTLRKPSNGAQS
jgi:hypothetical protein